MVERVLIGNHPLHGMGLFVSQPLIGVQGANKFQMAWSTIFEQFQIVQSGSIPIPSGGATGTPPWITGPSWTNLGYYPIIFLSCDLYGIKLEYLSTSSCRVRRMNVNDNGTVSSNDASTMYYIITRSQRP